MELIEALRSDHRLIESVAGSAIAWAQQRLLDEAPDVRQEYVGFFRDFVRGSHHRREEEILFPALVEHAEVPEDRGPLAVLRDDHERLDGLLDQLESTDGDRAVLDAARELAHHVWEHVDKEDSVLLPEAEARLVRHGVRELDDPGADEEAQAARRKGELLLERFRPVDDPSVVRGEGCIACSAFAVTCRGIESEWWNAWEWQHHRSLEEG